MPSPGLSQSAVPLPSAEINLGGTSTAEKQFLTASAAGGRAAGQPLACRIPGSNTLKNRQFTIVVAGRVTGGTTTNLTINLALGASTTIANNTTIATTGAIAVNSMSGNFRLQCECGWDSTSKKLQGIMYGWVNATAVATAIMTSVVTVPDLSTESNLNLASSAPDPSLTVTGTFSSGNASNVAFIDTFEIIAD